mgnify:CR=1 FL=1
MYCVILQRLPQVFVFYIYRNVLLFDKGKILASIGSRTLIIDIMHTYRSIGGLETSPRPLVQWASSGSVAPVPQASRLSLSLYPYTVNMTYIFCNLGGFETLPRPLVQCASCGARVQAHQFPKHLISHFHYHRFGTSQLLSEWEGLQLTLFKLVTRLKIAFNSVINGRTGNKGLE